MKRLSAFFLVIMVAFAVMVGSQTRPWSWGPSLICLSVALLVALPSVFKETIVNWKLLALATVTAAWFAFRAILSPVVELREGDLLLLTAAIGTFITMGVVLKDKAAEKIFLWGLCTVLTANTVIIAIQIKDASFNPIFISRPVKFPSGFFGHYNECANFVAGAGYLLLGSAVFGSYGKLTRWLWGGIALVSLASIYFTLSRGGILAAGIAAMVFAFAALSAGLQGKKKWAKQLLIILPLAAILAVGFIYFGWSRSQEIRFEEGIERVADNATRLHLYSIAVSCISLHPWAGGGSRSFSWECNQFWQFSEHGLGSTRPEMVHNELLQSITDYGIVGGALLTILLCWICFAAFFRLLSHKQGKSWKGNGIIVGSIAGLTGIFIQSTFSFVFHLLPGILLLGICLARLASTSKSGTFNPKLQFVQRMLLAILSGAIVLIGLGAGIKGTRVMAALSPNLFHLSQPASMEMKIAALTKAIAVWPQSEIYDSRAAMLQRHANQHPDSSQLNHYRESAVSDYTEAIRRHPFYAGTRVNLARLLDYLGDDVNAELRFREAIALQGGLESAYKGRFRFTQYLISSGQRNLRENDPDQALRRFEEALEVYGKIEGLTYEERMEIEIPMMIGLGMAQEQTGDQESALRSYESVLEGSGYYHAGVLLSKVAESRWSERQPSKALTLFRKSRDSLVASRNLDPQAEIRKKELLQHLEQRIEFMTGAGIKPEE